MVEAIGAAINISMLGQTTIAPADIRCAAAAFAALPEESVKAIETISEDPLNWSSIDDSTLWPIAEAYIGCVDDDQLTRLIAIDSLNLLNTECVVDAWDGLLPKEAIAASITYNTGLEDLEAALVEKLAARAEPCGPDRQWWVDDVAIQLSAENMTDDEASCVATSYVDVLGVQEVLRRRVLGISLLDLPNEDRQRLDLPQHCGIDPAPANAPLNAQAADCLSGFGQGRMSTAIVDCEQPHNGEVVAVHDLSTDFQQWPGLRTLRDNALTSCQTDLAVMSGDLTEYGAGWDSPGRAAWELGDRTLTCVLVRGPRYESWRGSTGLVPRVAPTTTTAASQVVDLHSLSVGQCLFGTGLIDGDIGSGLIRVVDCTQPHHAEVFHVSVLDDPGGAPWPGDDYPKNTALSRCHPSFDAYVGRPWSESRLGFTYIYPFEADWAANDRLILCYLWARSGQKLTGSMASSNQ